MATNVTEKDKTLNEVIDFCTDWANELCYDKDMCCLYIAEGMTYIWQQRENQELSRILESLADRKLMKRVHGGYAITLKGLLAVKVWRLHLFLFHHDEYKYFRRKK